MNQGSPLPPIQPLKQAVHTTIQHDHLDPHRMDTLLALQDELLGPENNQETLGNTAWQTRTKQYAAAIFSMAAVLVLSIGLNLWFSTKPDYTLDIAMEVVENHLKLKPLDISASNMNTIQGFFTQLDFSLTRSSLLDTQFSLNDTDLLGGRYCSIKGDTAAQIRYIHSDTVATFYQVGYDPDLYGDIPSADLGQAPATVMAKGLKVSLWVETGLLMVLIETP